MAKAGFWLQGARGKLNGAVIKGAAGGGTQISAISSPSNPNTARQVGQRAKFKLLSQLASNVAQIIAIPREGALSSRNQFVSINSANVMATNGVAQITLDNVQLTKSNLGFPQVTATRDSNGLTVEIAKNVADKWDRVCYVVMRKNSEGSLEQVASAIESAEGTDAADATSFSYTFTQGDFSGNIIVWAYGMKDQSASASAKYGNMIVATADDLAKLLTDRTFAAGEVRLSQTRGLTMLPNQNSVEAVPDGSQRVYVTALGNGTVTGAGTKTVGSSVTVTATAGEGATFTGWRLNGSSSYVSTAASYTFTMPDETVDLVAVFYTPDGGDSGGIGQN